MFHRTPKAPWKKYYSKKDRQVEIPDISLYKIIKEQALMNPNNVAIDYFGKKITYKNFIKEIDKAARSFRCYGIRPGDVVTICMPNMPEGVISFYALNKIGAIANMIHPLSAEEEIKNYLNEADSVMLVAVDICYEKIERILSETKVYKVILVSANDSMPKALSLGYTLTKGLKIRKPKSMEVYTFWKDFIKKSELYNYEYEVKSKKDITSVILHSGGTTGIPKGIVLTNGNLNALALQVKIVFKDIVPGDKILAIMPIFHGFGLGVSVHSGFVLGAEVVLVPQFSAKTFDNLVKRNKPQVIVGVPTLFEALLNNKGFNGMDMSYVKHFVSGGDSLTEKQNDSINEFLRNHGCNIKVEQGYGMTESVAATALAFGKANKPCTIGIPFPGNYFKIVAKGTQEEVKFGEVGEICVCGPTVMQGYYNNEKETNLVLQIHKDGNIWLHTGDIGTMDEDGVITYVQRLKRMIISSGYNVYPQQIEQVIETHPEVLKCTVVAMPHKYKVQVAKAYIVLKEGISPSGSLKKEIKELCEKNLSKFSIPYDYEYRKSLPKTLIGKVDYKQLEREAIEKSIEMEEQES
ncbi:MAG: AMP-binding protein [Candidatus Faecimonas sp.]|nr:AMP-binding protein [Mycoplasmatota bacterium]MDY2908454.1 AMP-binding protein [Candidatus Faecimonas sp.]